jgi:alkylation response protein AidB-like acyl-CoA dehydrogenase
MLTEIEAARELTYLACWKFSQGIDAVKEVSMAKLYSSEMANRVAYQCLQLYGGYGFMMEYPIQRVYRDMRLMPIGGGTSEIMKEIIGRVVGI